MHFQEICRFLNQKNDQIFDFSMVSAGFFKCSNYPNCQFDQKITSVNLQTVKIVQKSPFWAMKSRFLTKKVHFWAKCRVSPYLFFSRFEKNSSNAKIYVSSHFSCFCPFFQKSVKIMNGDCILG